jgi:hypothetical protein
VSGRRQQSKKSRYRFVEILHIDTEESQKFFRRRKASFSQKCDCEKVLQDSFQRSCKKETGKIKKWQGDGGFAFFPGEHSGGSIRAATRFLEELPLLHQQTSDILGLDSSKGLANRYFRVAAHFGKVYFDKDGDSFASDPEYLDSFLKHERDIAPKTNQIYITGHLWKQLETKERSKFTQAAAETDYGDLRTPVFRLKKQPKPQVLLRAGKKPNELQAAEWELLKRELEVNALLSSTRNSITSGLIGAVSGKTRGALLAEKLRKLTVRGIFNFFQSAFLLNQFEIALWRPASAHNTGRLIQAAAQPAVRPKWSVADSEESGPLGQTFTTCSPLIYENVYKSFLNQGLRRPDKQKRAKRGISALYLPVYRMKNLIGSSPDPEPLAVLAVYTNQARFFRDTEMDVWTDRLRGFLANLALAEYMMRTQKSE